MCKVYGYCRISTMKQDINRQIRNILAVYPSASIITEAYTGTKVSGRKEFERLLQQVREGDTIVFDSVSRMSRNAEEGFAVYEELFANGINLVFLKEQHINTDTYRQTMNHQIEASINCGDKATDNMVNAILSAINAYTLELAKRQIELAFNQAEKEVNDLHQRTKEGIETARRNGKQIGAVKGSKLNVKKAEPAKEIIMKHSKDFYGTLTDAETMKLAGISRNTYYKYKRELTEGQR